MPINSETLNRQLYKRLSKYKPKPLDADGNVTPIEDEADVFKFTFSKDGEDYGTVFATIDDNHALTVYYNDDVTESPPGSTPGIGYDDSWFGLVKQLKSWAMHNQLSWQLKDRSHLEGDMARRNHMNKKDKIAEGYYPMGKSRSYSDSIPSVKIVIEHSRQIEEGEQRYRNINKIFLENQMGERFLLDTKKPGIARVYARHIAEGGKVNDERWNHIQGLCEEYQKMAGFVRATRNGQFNESAQKLVNEAINHYQGLRESLSKMTGKRGYEAYFESWTPPLMEDEAEETNLNELFVQETLDPRIESVMPILSKLQKNLGEMKEVNALAEWADSLLEGGDGGEASEEEDGDTAGDAGEGGAEDAPEDDLMEAPGAETLAHNEKTVKGNLDAFDLDEDESLTSKNPIGIPEEIEEDWSAPPQDTGGHGEHIRQSTGGNYNSYWLSQLMKDPSLENYISMEIDHINKPSNELLQGIKSKKWEGYDGGKPRYDELGGWYVRAKNPMYFKEFLKALSQSVTKDIQIRAKIDPFVKNARAKNAEIAEDGEFAGDYATGEAGQWRNKGPKANKPATIGDLVGENFINTDAQAVVSEMDKSEDKKGPEGKAKPITPKKMADDAKKVLDKEKVKEGQDDLDAIKRLLGK